MIILSSATNPSIQDLSNKTNVKIEDPSQKETSSKWSSSKIFGGIGEIFKAIPRRLTSRASYESTVEDMGKKRLEAVQATLKAAFPGNPDLVTIKTLTKAISELTTASQKEACALFDNYKKQQGDFTSPKVKSLFSLVLFELKNSKPENVKEAFNTFSQALESFSSQQERYSFEKAPQALVFTQTLNSVKHQIHQFTKDDIINLKNHKALKSNERFHIFQVIWDLPLLASDEEIKKSLIETWPDDSSFLYNESNLQLQLQRLKKIKWSMAVRDPSQTQEINDEVGKLTRKVTEIKTLLQSPITEGFHDHMQKVREKINEALLLPIYRFCKEDENNACVHFLHLASYYMNTQAEGMSSIEAFGAKLIEDYAPNAKNQVSYTCAELASVLKEVMKNHPGFKREGVGKVSWAMTHPEKCLATVQGQLKGSALELNSYQHGNANIHYGKYVVNGVEIDFSAGPTPTGDKLYEAHLQLLKNKGSVIHLQQDLQHPKIKGEDQRRLHLKEIEAKHEKNNWLMSMPLDGDAWKSKKEFKNIESVEDYYLKLAKLVFFNDPSQPGESIEEVFACHLKAGEEVELNEMVAGAPVKEQAGFAFTEMQDNPKEDNGFFISDKVMSSKEVRNMLAASKLFFEHLETNAKGDKKSHFNDLLNLGQEGQKRLNKAMLLNYVIFSGAKAICKQGEAMADIEVALDEFLKPSVGTACKQGVDRGGIVYILSMLLGSKQISKKLRDMLVGSGFIRPLMTDDRVAVESRFEALSDLLDLIGDGDGFDKYKSFVTPYLSSNGAPMEFEFIPSNA